MADILRSRAYKNISLTDQALDRLRKEKCFCPQETLNEDTLIVCLRWILFSFVGDKNNIFEKVRGPHFQLTHCRIGQISSLKRAKLLRVDNCIICVEISRDFTVAKGDSYKLHYDKEFCLYSAELEKLQYSDFFT